MYVALGATLEACVLIVGSLQAGDLGLDGVSTIGVQAGSGL
jgi:hypothetical protein